MLLGVVITLLFTAANVYLGLKVGLTFASSIPAAVISMAVLKFFKGSNILENNMVQTQASAAGCLSSIIFVLPGMLMLGYWQVFPFWQTMLICAAGGILGVIFTIPLRQVMVVESKLPYPEGVAAAEILKAGDAHTNQEECATSPKEGMRLIVRGGALSGIMALLTGGFRVVADSVAVTFNAGAAIFNLQFGFSFALLGAGFLVGITGGIAMMVGTIIAWCGGVPIISSIFPADSGVDLSYYAVQVWATKVRYIGAGCIAISAISNDNMQDLKTGYLVGATPWRQQVALIIGCIVGAFVIAPVLELLYQAYGFTGAMPREGMDPSLALSAPQANLMATIADGIFTHQLEWTYVIIGTVLGVSQPTEKDLI